MHLYLASPPASLYCICNQVPNRVGGITCVETNQQASRYEHAFAALGATYICSNRFDCVIRSLFGRIATVSVSGRECGSAKGNNVMVYNQCVSIRD